MPPEIFLPSRQPILTALFSHPEDGSAQFLPRPPVRSRKAATQRIPAAADRMAQPGLSGAVASGFLATAQGRRSGVWGTKKLSDLAISRPRAKSACVRRTQTLDPVPETQKPRYGRG